MLAKYLGIEYIPRTLRARPYFGHHSSAAMVAKVGSVFGTLRHRHLIQPYLAMYLAYYDHLASHYGGPWCSPNNPGGAIKIIYMYLSRLSTQK